MNFFFLPSSLYQFLHPWHWLTYRDNAAAVAAIATVLTCTASILGLFFLREYTKDTREIMTATSESMKTSASALRYSMKPVLGLSKTQYDGSRDVSGKTGRLSFAVKNIGNGPACRVYWGCSTVSSDIKRVSDAVHSLKRLLAQGQTAGGGSLLRALSEGDVEDISLQVAMDTEYLLLVNCLDIGNNLHQTQLFFHCYHGRPNIPAGSITTHRVNFVERSYEERESAAYMSNFGGERDSDLTT